MAQALFLIGFTAATAQVVLLRELLVVCSGNELSLGLALTAWLLWTAAGSALAPRRPDALNQMALLQALTALVLPLSVMGVRHGRQLAAALPGEMLGPGAMALLSLGSLAPFCLISGALFATGVRMYGARSRGGPATAAAKVYLLDTLGAGVAGLCASFVLLEHASAAQIALFLAWLNLIAAATVGIGPHWYRRTELLAWLILVPLLLFPALTVRIETAGMRQLWPGMQVAETRNSRYGNLVVTSTNGTLTLYSNGLAALHVPDRESAEEAVEWALLEHAAPARVLLLGGGMNGSLRLLLAQPGIERVDYAELDPAVLELARIHFAAEWRAVTSDARLHLHSVDGRRLLAESDRAYDVVIVNLPDPRTSQLNRFYTSEFFRLTARRLRPGGVLALQATGAENYISPRLAGFLASLRATLQDAFPAAILLPGPTVHLIGGLDGSSLTTDPLVLGERIRQRGIETLYLRPARLRDRLRDDRRLEWERLTQPSAGTARNRDFAPLAFFYDTALWTMQFGPLYQHLFTALESLRFTVLAVVVAAMSGLGAWLSRRRQVLAPACLAATGCCLIGCEIMLLLGFQAVHGYVYHALALLTACFMAGMALGSYVALHLERATALAGTQLAAALLPGLLSLLLAGAPAAAFALAALGCGALGGWQFPLACRRGPRHAPGTLYAADLAGAALGGLLVSLWWLPLYGFARCALLLGLLNLPLAWAARRPAR